MGYYLLLLQSTPFPSLQQRPPSFLRRDPTSAFPHLVLHKFRFIMVYLRTEYGMICAFASLSPSITFKTPFKRILRRIDATHSPTSFSSIPARLSLRAIRIFRRIAIYSR